jgi:hypothetical protein
LRTIAADPAHLGAELGFFAVLHTWGQTLVHHPHLHCVIPGGGLAPDGTRWVSCRPGFFLPVRVLSRLFRRVFLDQLCAAFDRGELQLAGRLEPLADRHAFRQHVEAARQVEWVVYAKRPFAGPRQVLEYVGRYTHRVAIANSRLAGTGDGTIQFRWKDYRTPEAPPKVMTLSAVEFIRRFLLHVLPQGFQRIRYFGFLGNRHRSTHLTRCRALLGASPTAAVPIHASDDYRDRYEALTGRSLRTCPCCRAGHMRVIDRLERVHPIALVTDADANGGPTPTGPTSAMSGCPVRPIPWRSHRASVAGHRLIVGARSPFGALQARPALLSATRRSFDRPYNPHSPRRATRFSPIRF